MQSRMSESNVFFFSAAGFLRTLERVTFLFLFDLGILIEYNSFATGRKEYTQYRITKIRKEEGNEKNTSWKEMPLPPQKRKV